jgi:hypothetical protein
LIIVYLCCRRRLYHDAQAAPLNTSMQVANIKQQ